MDWSHDRSSWESLDDKIVDLKINNDEKLLRVLTDKKVSITERLGKT